MDIGKSFGIACGVFVNFKLFYMLGMSSTLFPFQWLIRPKGIAEGVSKEIAEAILKGVLFSFWGHIHIAERATKQCFIKNTFFKQIIQGNSNVNTERTFEDISAVEAFHEVARE